MICLYLQAPFGVFRNFTAGNYRSTAGFLTHSAVYGLLLNIAGIEMREYKEEFSMTLIKTNLPSLKIALGALQFPLKHSLYQQLHNYKVQPTPEDKYHRIGPAKGNKYNIKPIRRAILSRIKAYICADGNEKLEKAVVQV